MLTSPLPLIVVLLSIVTLGVTGNLLSGSPVVIALQVVAVGLSVWARRSFPSNAFRVTAKPEGESVIRNGPYGFIRHPMHSAALLLIWTSVIGHPSVFTLVIACVASAVVIARTVAEERLLRAGFHDYGDYAKSTKALVPYLF